MSRGRPLIPPALVAPILALCFVAAPTSVFAQGRITVEDSAGGPPGDHFTNLTMVPGDTNSSTIVVSQNTGSAAKVGVRFEPESEPNALHEQAELSVEGLGETTTASLGEMLDSDSPIWLGVLPSDEEADLHFVVHLPDEAGNDTKQKQAGFKVIVTAQADVPDGTPPPESPGPSPTETDDSRDPSPSPDPSTSSDPDPSEEPRPDPDPDGDLPRTGPDIFLLILVAATLTALGALAVRAARRRS